MVLPNIIYLHFLLLAFSYDEKEVGEWKQLMKWNSFIMIRCAMAF